MFSFKTFSSSFLIAFILLLYLTLRIYIFIILMIVCIWCHVAEPVSSFNLFYFIQVVCVPSVFPYCLSCCFSVLVISYFLWPGDMFRIILQYFDMYAKYYWIKLAFFGDLCFRKCFKTQHVLVIRPFYQVLVDPVWILHQCRNEPGPGRSCLGLSRTLRDDLFNT